MTIYYDNQVGIAYTKDHIKYNYVQDIVLQNEIILQYINTYQMVKKIGVLTDLTRTINEMGF